jgi:hypothetical protein
MTEEKTSALDVRPLVVALAVLLAVAAVWAATGFAGGGGSTPSSDPVTGADPVAAFIQEDDDRDGFRRGDCPEDGDGSGGDSESGEPSSADF